MKRYLNIASIDSEFPKQVKDFLALGKCLQLLLSFFKTNSIQSQGDNVESFDNLLKDILSSKIMNFVYDPNIDEYNLILNSNFFGQKRKVYFFNFGDNSQPNYTVIDFDNSSQVSQIKISLKTKKYLPFAMSFDPNIDPGLIMSVDEFAIFLDKNKQFGKLRVIDVP